MRFLTTVLAVASLILPPPHRARWREESAGLLIEVRGVRRWWFALDIVLKAPVLAWCHRVAEPPLPQPGRVVAALTGAGLLVMPLLGGSAILFASALGEGAAEFLFLVSPFGMFGFVAVHTFRRARRHGGGLPRYTGAALLSIFAGTGPVASGALSVAVGVPLIAIAGAVVPGVWLVVASAVSLARRDCPRSLALLGVAGGLGLTGVLAGVQLVSHVPAAAPVASAGTMLSVLLLIPCYLIWSAWTGVRLLRGRTGQLA
ncbi:hypothetical protein [Actinoplanes utahensis]|uniref:Uncharacterized protein n=1 Tax=Actinoplanes utahensis TaxID=1869 RepID=A0A0A6UM28_ACTUT|nr:hypothetical protein [Actinoplanes utahensis]KHD75349.1 hypothetical protein MB27_23195 [Actinoplanes utahensis]GIF33752.1 hypothetical protein Aut01nite_67380 [Actinoplanes utahensis]